MSRFHEEIRQTLVDAEHFLITTLSHVALSNVAKKEKDSILGRIDSLRENYSSLLPPREIPEDDVSGGTMEDGSSGGGFMEEPYDAYGNAIPAIAATELYGTSKSSMLLKRRKPGSKALVISAYQKRWCALKGNLFYYYDKHTDKKQAGAFSVAGYEFRDAPFLLEKEPNKKDLSFELIRPGHRVYQFLATTKEDYAEWKDVVTKAALIVEKPQPQVTAPAPATSPQENESDEELYEPLDEAPDTPSNDAQRPMSEEIYDDIAANQEPGEVYDDCTIQTATPKKVPQIPASQPPTLPSYQSPQVPNRGGDASPKVPTLPPRNLKSTEKGADVIYPDFKNWKLGVENDYESMYYGKWDCEMTEDNELSFKRGDILHVLSKEYDSKQWWVAELGGRVGLVPKVYLTEAYQLVD